MTGRFLLALAILLGVTSPAVAVPVVWDFAATSFGSDSLPNGPITARFTFEPVAMGDSNFVTPLGGSAVLHAFGREFHSTSLEMIYQHGQCPDHGCGGGQLAFNVIFAGFGAGFFGDTAIDFTGDGSVYRTPPFQGWGQETVFWVNNDMTNGQQVFMRTAGGHFTDVTKPPPAAVPTRAVPAPPTLLLLGSGLLLVGWGWRRPPVRSRARVSLTSPA